MTFFYQECVSLPFDSTSDLLVGRSLEDRSFRWSTNRRTREAHREEEDGEAGGKEGEDAEGGGGEEWGRVLLAVSPFG